MSVAAYLERRGDKARLREAAELFYKSVAEYDCVLRAHCRLDDGEERAECQKPLTHPGTGDIDRGAGPNPDNGIGLT
jgi:hypothetical protein